MGIIGTYEQLAPACHEYDSNYPAAANLLIALMHARDPRLIAYHVGSTSVPNCAGKGVIDLLVTYPAGSLPSASALLQALGFQAQTSRNPFPEERPLRVGSLQHMGRHYRIHAHVVNAQSPEVKEMLWFRERLEMDTLLRTQYVAEKRRILLEGVADSTEYAERKGAFIQAQLQTRRV
ncbi:hypothetical protein EMGBS3_02100 [Anaerolineaceae bacterium]|nr:hypothetical protein EMGBS3_02100 [Anaerolineaceae bacterium]